MPEFVKMIGFDFGSTTSSAVIASARLRRSAVGRTELDIESEIFRSEMAFTPVLADGRLDIAELERMLDGWLAAGHVQAAELFGGGALLTGLTAQSDNAPTLVACLRRRLGDALIATADDPCLESWLAFMGSCAALSGQFPDKHIMNLDIGGGTTNLALGRDRQVLRTGCLWLGARHVQVEPGGYRVLRLSSHARELFEHLGLRKGPGDELGPSDVEAIVSTSVAVLEDVCTGATRALPIVNRLQQIPFERPAELTDVVYTFSGGVGELIYRLVRGEPWPKTTHYGDLGIDLAQRIAATPLWADSLKRYQPDSGGRATVYGLMRHATEISGNTLFLGSRDMLPLADMPILGRLDGAATLGRIREALTLVRQSNRGGCLQIRLGHPTTNVVRDFGLRLADALEQCAFPCAHPLILLVEENVGKTLGHYATRWGALPMRLLVVDELPLRAAQYVHIGTPRGPIVPVSCYGFLPPGEDL